MKTYKINFQINLPYNRFDNISEKGILTCQTFKDSLGLMGLDNYLVDRIFNLIDEDNDGKASFEDFVKYLNVLMNGS